MKQLFLFMMISSLVGGCSKIPGSIDQVMPPVFSMPAGIYGHAIDISLSTVTTKAKICYTLDGSIPGSLSPLYTAPVTMSETGRIYRFRAAAFMDGMAASDVSEASYVIVRAGTEDVTNWNKSYKDSVGIGIVVPIAGYVCVVGYGLNLVSVASGEDAVVKLFNSSGEQQWTPLLFDTAGSDDRAIAVDADSDGTLYVAGTATNIISTTSVVDWTLRKISLSGTCLGEKAFDGGSGNDYMNAVRLDSKRNVYITGSGYNRISPTSRDDWWVKKFDSDLNEVEGWDLSFDGNLDEDYINDIIIDSSDNVYIAGCGKNLTAADSGFDWWVKKFDENGSFLWEKKYDGNRGDDYINSVAIDSLGNVYLVGNGENIVGSGTQADRWIKKLQPDGTQIWDQRYDGNGGNDYLNSAVVDSDGYLHVVGAGYVMINGNSNYDWWLERLNPEGAIDTIYPRTLDADNKAYYANTIVVDEANTYVTGYIEYIQDSATVREWWIKKFYR
jgi:hypothetical protein